MAYTYSDILGQYNRGAPGLSAGSFSEPASRFGLSEEEIARGLDAFGKWHTNRFGVGFTPSSSSSAIVNGAIQNALNARADHNFYNQGWQSFEGGSPVANALNFSATPERIAAHRQNAIDALVSGGWLQGAMNTLNRTGNNQGFSPDYRVHSMYDWTPDEGKRLAALAVDTSVGKVNDYLQQYLNGIHDAGSASAWWGPEAVLSNMATSFGLDPSKYIDNALYGSQQDNIGKNWQANEIRAGQEEDASNATALGVIGAALGGLSSLGAFGGGLNAAGGAADLAAAFGDTGLGYGAGSASMGGAAGMGAGSAPAWTSGQDLLGGADLNFQNMSAPATGGTSGGNAMDWTDFLPSGTDSGGSFLDYIPTDAGPLTDVGSNLNLGDVLQGMSDYTGGSAGVLNTIRNMPVNTIKSLFGVGDSDAAKIAGMLGKLGGGLLDYMGSSNQSAALKEIADRSWAAGQPYRDRANAAMTPGFDIRSIPGLSSAMDTATDAYLRRLSATNGNPVGIGAAPSQTQAYVIGNVGLPAWQNYFNANSNAGGLSNLSAQANTTATQAAQADAGTWGSLGQTARQIFGDDDQYSQIGRKLASMWGLG